MFLARILNILTVFSILSNSLSYGLPVVENNFEKDYEKLDVKAIADLFMNGGEPTEPLEHNLVDYVPTKITNKRTIIRGDQGPGSIYPFVVAQNAATDGVVGDSLAYQFDVIEDKNGNEFFALYDLGVKRVKGLLLMEVANTVKDLLPLLDRVTHPMIKYKEEDSVIKSAAAHAEIFQKEIEKRIKDVFADVDQEAQAKFPNEMSAAASIVIVTKYNLIVAWLGNVRVLTYDNHLKTKRLTNDHSSENEKEVRHHKRKGFKLCRANCWWKECYMTRSFPDSYMWEEKYHDTEPEIKFSPRYFSGDTTDMVTTQFVVLEASGIAKGLKDTKVTDSIIRAVKSSNDNRPVEDSMYSGTMVNSIYDEPLRYTNPKIYDNDFNVLIVGLE